MPFPPLPTPGQDGGQWGHKLNEWGGVVELEIEGLQEDVSSKVDLAAISAVATSGMYSDLIGTPEAFPPTPHNHDGVYVKPESLAGVALSGAYADLSGRPTIPTTLTGLDTTVTGAQLNALKAKVDGVAAGAEVNVQSDWNAASGDAFIANKPTLGTAAAMASTAFATAAQGVKADTAVQPAAIANFETTTQLNTRDTNNRARANHTGTQSADTLTDGTTNKAFLATERTKLTGIQAGAEVNVQADWNAASGDAAILNKPATFTPIAHTHVATNITDFGSAADARITAQKAIANGLATLDAAGKVPSSQLPSIALTDVSVVATQAAQLALVAQEGDVAIRTDQSRTYVHNGGVAGTMADWAELLSPGDAVTSVNGQTGTVSLTTTNIAEGTNLYYTDARVIANTTVAANTAARHTHSNKTTLDAVTAAYTTAEKTKLTGIATGATANSTDAQLRDRATHTGTQSADTITNGTANKVFTAAEQTKLTGIQAGAEVNVQADWDAISGDAQILNKPTLGTAAAMASTAFATAAQGTKADTAVQPAGLTKAAVGLGNVDNTSDANKPVSTATATALSGKAATSHTHPVSDLTATGTRNSTTILYGDNTWKTAPSGGGGVTDHTLLTNIGTNTHAQIDTHIASTANPHSVTKAQVGLGSVDNTSDAAKPVSTATQTALNGKADTAHSHTITGSIALEFHGGGAAIEAGAVAMVRMNFAGTFTGWDVYAGQSGSFVGTVGRATHAAYPTFTAISGTSKPTLASATKNQSTALTGWTTAFADGSVIRIVVDSATTVEDVSVSLRYTRTV